MISNPIPRVITAAIAALLVACFGMILLPGPASAKPIAAAVAQMRPESADIVQETPHPVLNDIRVRRAIAYCTDREAIIASLYPFLDASERQTLLMDTFVPKSHPMYDPPAAEYTYPFDPSAGQALLDQAGWTLPTGAVYRRNNEGYELTLKLTTSDTVLRQTWGALLETQLRDHCGIRLLRSHVPSSTLFGTGPGSLARREFELAGFAWIGQPSPAGATLYGCYYIPTPDEPLKGQNYMGWCNSKAEDALYRAGNTLDAAESKAQYAIVQDEFAKDMVSLPLFQYYESYGATDSLLNYKPDPTEYDTWNAYEWELPGQDTLVMVAQEPSNLYRLNASGAYGRLAWLIFEDGASSLTYDYQAALLSELPTLDSGLATLQPVPVEAGAPVMDVAGVPVTLAPGVRVRTANGQEIEYNGGTITMQQLVVSYQFQPNLRWSDGQPVRAANFEKGYEHDCDPESGAISFWACMATADFSATDTGYTITYRPGALPETYFLPPFEFYPTHQVITSAGEHQGKTLGEVPVEDWITLPEITRTPLGVGPYMITNWNPGVQMDLTANPYYWRGANVPRIKNIVIRFDLTTQEANQALRNGTIDILDGAFPPDDSAGVKFYNLASATWEHVDMNLGLYTQATARRLSTTGGEITTDIGLALTVPSGALSEPATIVLNEITVPTHPLTGPTPLRVFTLDAFNDQGEAITEFAQPLTLVIDYTDAGLAERGITEDQLNVLFWNGDRWVSLLPCAGCTVDTANNRVTVQLTHFTEFALTVPGPQQIYLPHIEQ